jgi:hypothetical protein
MIAMIHRKSNEERWRDKGHDHCDCKIERRAVSDEESKESDSQWFDWQSRKEKEKNKDHEYKSIIENEIENREQSNRKWKQKKERKNKIEMKIKRQNENPDGKENEMKK